MRLTPCALSIAGLDPSGGAGLYADLRAFQAASVWGCGAVAVMTVQTTRGLEASEPVPTAMLLAQVHALYAHQNIRAVKIGALGSLANVRGVTRWLAQLERPIPVVIDPVLAASRGKRDGKELLESSAVAALLRMSKLSALITPNAPEAESLLEMRVQTLADAERAARAFVALGARAALVKGGHWRGHARGETTDVLAIGSRVIHLHAERVKVTPHGTGCTLASLIAGKLAAAPRIDDDALVASVRWAKRKLASRIAHPLRIGDGQLVMP
jgi:hydroxymethylpyrimidine/phosphomethylpyrimidine kinase